MLDDRLHSRELVSSAPTDDTVVRTADLSVSFGGVRAVSDVSLSISVGELVAVVGPNGAGKTTLLNAVTGLLRGALHGTVAVRGRVTTSAGAADVARLGVARSFQEPRLMEDETVLENVLCGTHLNYKLGAFAQVARPIAARRAESRAKKAGEAVLELLDLTSLRGERVSDLPYGHRKLIDIGRAIVARPLLLLLDEPSSGLDEHEQETVSHIVRELCAMRPDLTVVMVEHHMNVVRRVASRLVAMQSGALIMDGEPAVVMETEEFKDALVGRTRTTTDSEGRR